MKLEDLGNINFGDIFMWVGMAMVIAGGFGLSLYSIFASFNISAPLGLVVLMINGFIIGLFGHTLVD